MRDTYRADAGEMRFNLDWFRVHQFLLPSWGDISVFLVLWQCTWGFSGVPSRKLWFLPCLIGNKESLCIQCREIGPHLVARGSFMSFLELRQAPGVYSRLKVGMSIWYSGLFSEVRTPLYVRKTPEEFKLGLARQYGPFWSWGGSASILITCHSYFGIPINYHEDSGIVTFWNIELRAPLEVSKGCDAPCPEEAET